VAAADDAVGADLYRMLPAAGGLVFSPASIAAALRLALLGARGQTAAELAAVLHLSSPGEAGGGLALLGSVAGGDAGVTFRAPNTVWVQAGLPLRPEFAGAVTALAAAAVHATDFAGDPGRACADINAVIADQTAGKIPDLLGPGSVGAATRLVLASAVYLKAAWAHPFPAGATSQAPFHAEDGRELSVPMMRVTARLGYRRGDGYQAVVLPYAGGRLAMAVILPDGPPGLAGPVTGRLATGGVAGLLAGTAPQQVRLGLPRFREQARFELGPALQRLGMTTAFSDKADFGGITEAGQLAAGSVAHSAFIDTGEHGTEAAAATGVTMVAAAMTTGSPVEVTVDRPFLFAITDTASGLPLFLGRVTEPAGG
jgi:serpin B